VGGRTLNKEERGIGTVYCKRRLTFQVVADYPASCGDTDTKEGYGAEEQRTRKRVSII